MIAHVFHFVKYVTVFNSAGIKGKKIRKTLLSGKLSATLIIPIEVARKYGLERPSHVVVEEIDEGILIRKLKFNGDETEAY
jgi:hypothetical protein